MMKALLICITGGLIWQFVLVLVLVGTGAAERSLVDASRGTLASVAAKSPKRPDRRLAWLLVIPLIVLFSVEEFLPVFRTRTTAISESSSTPTSGRAS